MLRLLFRLLPLSLRTKKHLKYFYFKGMAALGIEEFPALNGIDRKMRAYLPERGGVFVEAGANDGVTQSNTWFFESYRGWTGLLVEPVPALAEMARKFRRAPVVNAALGPADQDGVPVTLVEDDLVTTLARDGSAAHGRRLSAPMRPLSALLDEHGITSVDFFSLDVEGAEIAALRGLDMERHAPRYVLVETANFEDVRVLLGAKYDFVEALSVHDYLFACRTETGEQTR